MKKLECDVITAKKLIEAWKFMDYNTDIVMKSIDGIKKHGLHLGFCETVNWACAMAEVDLPDEENEREFEEVIAMGKEEQKYQEYLQEKEDEREYRIPNNPFKWIPLGDVEDEQVPWMMRQPAWVSEEIESLSRINDIDELTKVGKKAYKEKERFTPDQSGVFWTQYNIRKKVLMRRLEPNFNKLVEFVKTTDKKMGWLGKYLWNLQKEVKLKLAYPQWKAVWEVWNLRKEKSGPQQPKRLEDCPAFGDNPEIDEYAMMMDTLKKMEEEAYTEIP